MDLAKDVLIVAALRSELPEIGKRAGVCFTGVGIHRAREKLAERLAGGDRPSLLLSAGLSGALDPELRAGDIVVARKIVFGDLAFAAQPVDLPGIAHRRGIIYCSSRTVGRRDERQRLHSVYDALCVDMESGAVAELAREHGIPVAVVRAVMDSVDDAIEPFESPHSSEDWAEVKEAIERDMESGMSEKARLAVAALEQALDAFLGGATTEAAG